MSKHEIIQTKSLLMVNFDAFLTNNHIVPNHWHPHLEVLYILQGSMKVICNEVNYVLNSGDLFIVNSGDIHYTKAIGQANLIMIQIPYSILTETISEFDQLHFKEYFSTSEIAGNQLLQNMIRNLESMKTLFEKKEKGYQFLFTSHLNLFLYTLYSNYSTKLENQAAKSTIRLRNIITYVEEHYTEPLTLHQVADEFALNPEYFCRFFKRNMSFTFFEYVNMVRLNHIYYDLTNTKDSITQITQRHGFSNYKVFNRMFQDIYGCSASKVRKL